MPAAAPSPTSGVAAGIPAPRDNGPELEHQHQLVAASHAANAARRRAAQRTVRTRRRGIAVLGAASILAAGGGWVVVDKSRPAVPDTTSVTGNDVASGTAEWASRAELALASLDSQLDLVNQVQAAWNALPEARSGILPQPVVELLAHKARLEQQRAMLVSELSALKSLETSRAALLSTEDQLAAVEHALQAIPSSVALSPEQAEAARQLKAQRDVLAQQRDNRRREVLAWENSVRSSVTKPLPELEKETRPVTDDVIALVDNSGRPSSPPPEARVRSPLPAATNRQEWAQRARQDYDTGAPPNPGRANWDEFGQGPDTETGAQRVEQVAQAAHVGPAAQQTVDPEVIDAVWRQLITGQATGDATAPAAGVPARAASKTTAAPGTTSPGTASPKTTTARTAALTPMTPGVASPVAPKPAAPAARPRPAATPRAAAPPAQNASRPTPAPTSPVTGSSPTAPAPAAANPAPPKPAAPSPSPTPTPRARAAAGPATTPTGTTTTSTTTPRIQPSTTPTTSPTPSAAAAPAAPPTRVPQPVAS